MLKLKPSQKLADYLNKVRRETGREIRFEYISHFPIPSMKTAYRYDPSLIEVVIASNAKMTTSQLEQSIAHEVTHGFLQHKLRYCHAVFKRPPSDTEEKSTSLIFTMIDDIVVNRIISEEGFDPFGPVYLPTVEKETKAIRKGKDCYNRHSHDPLFKDRYMVFRYIMAWGFLEYFDLEPFARRKIKKFAKTFENSFPRQYEMASQIRELILQNDIFTSEGHRRTIEGVLKFWNLEDLVELKTG